MKNPIGGAIVFGVLFGVTLYIVAIVLPVWGVNPSWTRTPQCFVVSAGWSVAVIGVHMLPRGLGAEGKALERVLIAEYEIHFRDLVAAHGSTGAKRIIALEMKESRYGLTQAEEQELLGYAIRGARAEKAATPSNDAGDFHEEVFGEKERRAA